MRFLRTTAILILVGLPSGCALETASPRRPAPQETPRSSTSRPLDASQTERVQRIMMPLQSMGASIEARDGKFPPLAIHGRPLKGIEYTLPVASAQVKSCVLLAGLFASGDTIVHEPVRTRDHTEIALQEFGAEIESFIEAEKPKPPRPDLVKPPPTSAKLKP